MKKILVTGSHRSGTTWTGKVISKAKGVSYVHEPFNIGIRRNYSPLTYWFEYVSDKSSLEHITKVTRYIASFSSFFELIKIRRLGQIWSARGFNSYINDITRCLFFRRTLIKDPIAIMSAEWLYKNFDTDVVVLIRHPAAFVSSLKVKNWQFDFNNFLSQADLMNHYLKEYEDLFVEYSNNKKDIIDQGILLWNSIHKVIEYYKVKYKDEWYFVRHEDLSRNAQEEFQMIFKKINLNFSSDVKDYIKDTTLATDNLNVILESTSVPNVTRNSVKNIQGWKKRLSDNEIQRIKLGTNNIWKKFYDEDDW